MKCAVELIYGDGKRIKIENAEFEPEVYRVTTGTSVGVSRWLETPASVTVPHHALDALERIKPEHIVITTPFAEVAVWRVSRAWIAPRGMFILVT